MGYFSIGYFHLRLDVDLEVLFILGCPFLANTWDLIDVATGKLTIRAHEKVKVFDVYKAMKLSSIYEELSAITIIELESELPLITSNDPLESFNGHNIFEDADSHDIM